MWTRMGGVVRRFACLAAIGVICVSTASAAATQRYLCRADQAIGFSPEGETWKSTKPDVTDRMYVVSPMDVFDGKYAVTQLGKTAPLYYCEPDDVEPTKRLLCGASKQEFIINMEAGRFQHFRSHGFIDAAIPPETGPILEIGRCFPFE